MTSSIPNSLSKTSFSSTIILEGRASTYEFGGNKIQFIAQPQKLACFYLNIIVPDFDNIVKIVSRTQLPIN